MISKTIVACCWKSSLLVGIVCLAIACGSKVRPARSAKPRSDYKEDASVFRPSPVPEASPASPPKLPASEGVANMPDHRHKVEQALDSAAQWNGRLRFIQGYRLLVYNGKNRDEANMAKSTVYKSIPGLPVFTEYKQPYFKVKVGNFFERLEAQPYLVKLREAFPNLLLVPEPIRLQDLKP
jgi:hypothetical protein